MDRNNLSAEQIRERIGSVAGRYDGLNCVVSLCCAGETARMSFGGMSAGDDERFIIDGRSGMLCGLTVLRLIGEGLIAPDTPVRRYITSRELALDPELTVGHLLRRASGLPDPLRSCLLTGLEREEGFSRLSAGEQASRRTTAMLNARGFAGQVELMAEGCHVGFFAPSSLDETLLCELAVRATGELLENIQRDHIFEPLGIKTEHGVHTDRAGHIYASERVPVEYTAPETLCGVYTATLEEMEKLMHAAAEGELLSSVEQSAVDAAANLRSLPFGKREGLQWGISLCAGWSVTLMFDASQRIGALIIADRPLPERRDGDVFRRFDLEVAGEINSLRIYPAHTRMERLSARNVSAAMAIMTGPSEHDYASAPAAELAMAAADRNRQCFVATEGGVAVGLLSYSVVPDGTVALLETVLVDGRFRRRGFGLIMVRWCIRHLRQSGVSRVALCVNHRNTAARSLYEKLGFELTAVYDSAYVMELSLL